MWVLLESACYAALGSVVDRHSPKCNVLGWVYCKCCMLYWAALSYSGWVHCKGSTLYGAVVAMLSAVFCGLLLHVCAVFGVDLGRSPLRAKWGEWPLHIYQSSIPPVGGSLVMPGLIRDHSHLSVEAWSTSPRLVKKRYCVMCSSSSYFTEKLQE